MFIFLLAGNWLLQSAAVAQSAHGPGAHGRQLVPSIIAETMPVDDSVLSLAPSKLDLNFPERVRLVKLVLYNDTREWVDLDFRYDPRLGTRFSWPVPNLQQATYYTANWAILTTRDVLVRGSFSFTFGSEPEPPSAHKQRAAEELEKRNSSLPEIEQLQKLGLDPAEIIINNEEPPKFEPPFAPLLSPRDN